MIKFKQKGIAPVFVLWGVIALAAVLVAGGALRYQQIKKEIAALTPTPAVAIDGSTATPSAVEVKTPTPVSTAVLTPLISPTPAFSPSPNMTSPPNATPSATASPLVPIFEWTADSGNRVSNGSVPFIYKMKDGKFRLYYCGKGGILSAVSSDGLNFQKESGARIAPAGKPGEPESMVCDASIVDLADGRMRMYYKGATGPGGPGEATHRIYSAVSSDGLDFQKEEMRIDSTKTGDRGWASVPEAIKIPDGRVRIYYVSDHVSDLTGQSHGTVSAISSDGLNFTREETKLANFVDPAAVILPDGKFLLLAVALPAGPGKNQDVLPGIYSFVSDDGINFKDRQTVLAGHMILDPSIIKISEGIYRIFYGDLSGSQPATRSISGKLK